MLLKLPTELRQSIYWFIFGGSSVNIAPHHPKAIDGLIPPGTKSQLPVREANWLEGINRTCRFIRRECLDFLYHGKGKYSRYIYFEAYRCNHDRARRLWAGWRSTLHDSNYASIRRILLTLYRSGVSFEVFVDLKLLDDEECRVLYRDIADGAALLFWREPYESISSDIASIARSEWNGTGLLKVADTIVQKSIALGSMVWDGYPSFFGKAVFDKKVPVVHASMRITRGAESEEAKKVIAIV